MGLFTLAHSTLSTGRGAGLRNRNPRQGLRYAIVIAFGEITIRGDNEPGTSGLCVQGINFLEL